MDLKGGKSDRITKILDGISKSQIYIFSFLKLVFT